MASQKKPKLDPQNPFAALKGFSVSGDAPPKPAEVHSSRVPVDAIPEKDEPTLFAEEMARLGVARGKDSSAAERPVETGTGEEGKDPKGLPATDEELFCAALTGMDTVFADEFPAEEELKGEPRRMRQLRRGQLLPEARIDLHGLHRDQAREKVRFFLENGLYRGYRTVLVITGRGLGSGSEPVLRNEIERYLTHEAAAWVLEWGRAPRQYGGNGALVVFLKG